MRHPDQERDAGPNWDSTFLNTRREALIIFAVWVATLLWAVPFSYLHGYDTGAVIDTVWGIPSWVFCLYHLNGLLPHWAHPHG